MDSNWKGSVEAYSVGLWGLSPPGPVKSIDFRGLSGPTGAEPPFGKRKKI